VSTLSQLSPQLKRLLVIRGVARSLAPILVFWGIHDWWVIHPLYGIIFALLTLNYVVVYVMTWIPNPALLQGPWRIRPWQTLLLLINAVLLPIVFKQRFGRLPWGFIAISILFFIGLYVATYILFYLQDRVPMGSIFAARKQSSPSDVPPSPTSPPPAAP